MTLTYMSNTANSARSLGPRPVIKASADTAASSSPAAAAFRQTCSAIGRCVCFAPYDSNSSSDIFSRTEFSNR